MARKILIIDDDKDLAFITGDMLKSYGYEITIVSNCEEAFEKLTDGQFHLILLDINLPDGPGYICQCKNQ